MSADEKAKDVDPATVVAAMRLAVVGATDQIVLASMLCDLLDYERLLDFARRAQAAALTASGLEREGGER